MTPLRYRGLFFRTALHIGVALTAFVVIGAVSIMLIAGAELRGYLETRSSTLGEEAARVLANGGQPALQKWLQQDAAIPDDVSIYILDETSNDLLGRQLPAEYSEFVRESVIGKPVLPGSNYRPVRLAPHLIAPDGQRYAFLVIPKGIGIWGSPMTLLSLIIVALLVIASVAWLIARTLSSPIGELQFAVRQLASGNTAVRVPEAISGRPDELGSLAADFNAMADQLTELISGREALLREMSHELRSPLARLHAAIALADERGTLPTDERDRLETEIARMNRVIGEMLRYSSMSNATAPRQKLVRIGKLLQELVEDEEIEATSHKCELQLDSQKGLAVIGDDDLLHSCFENILRNAIRYAPEGSAIKLRAQLIDETVQVEISDRGPGVPEENLERIFDPYFRVARGAHHQDSTGLGLAIVKRITKHHKGKVHARQRSGGGLKVTVRLPSADLN